MILNDIDYSQMSIPEQAEALAKQRRRYLQVWNKVPKPQYNSPYNDFDLMREGIALPVKGDSIRGYRFYSVADDGNLKGGYGYEEPKVSESLEARGYYYHNQEVSTAAMFSQAFVWTYYDSTHISMRDVTGYIQYPIVGTFDSLPVDDGFIASEISKAGEATGSFMLEDKQRLQAYLKEHYTSEGILK